MAAAVLSAQLGTAQLGLAQLGRRGAIASGGGGGGTQTIHPSGVATPRRFGTAVVAGPIIMASVPPAHAVGTPTVKANQLIDIAGDGITSRAAVGTPVVKEIQTIDVTGHGIASHAAVGTPVVEGSPQFIFTQGFKTARVGTPKIVGGRTDLLILVGGVDYRKYLQATADQNNVSVTSQTIGRWQSQFVLVDVPGDSIEPDVGMTVLFAEFGSKIFAGCMTDVAGVRSLSLDLITYTCTATDKSGICDHRVVILEDYPATMDGADVIRDIMSKYMVGEGVTTNNVPASLGAIGADLPLSFKTVTNALDQVTTLLGAAWWIDVNGDLNVSTFDNLPAAPFALTETSRNWRTLGRERSLIDFRTKEYAVSNLKTVPTGIGGVSGITRSQTYTVPQAAAVARQFINGAAVLDFPADAIVSLTVNGTPFQVYSGSDPATYNPTNSNYHQVWWWFPGSPYVNPPVSGPNVPANGATVVIQYITSASQAAVQSGSALAPTDPDENPLGTCGSGIYEHVTQVDDISLVSDLDAIATAELTRSGGVPTFLTFETDTPGLAPGQLLSVNIPKAGYTNATLMVIEVTGASMVVDLGHKSSFRWQIKATSNQDPGNWIKYFERLVARTENKLPLDRFETLTLIQPTGALLAGGTALGNPYIVENTGALIELLAAATTPPIDQDLTIQVFDGLTLIGQLTMKSSVSANELVEFTFLASSPSYVFRKDVLTAVASYSITGPNPTPVDGLTFKARWSY